MIRNIKALGLAIVAVLAFGALSASAASAVEFHSEVEKTKYTAEQDGGSQVFVTPAGTVTCSDVTGEATTTKTTNPTITATNLQYFNTNAEGKHTKCITKTIFGNVEVEINFTADECDFVFHANGEVDVVCKKAGGITISGPGCSITVPGVTGEKPVNQGLKTATYDNKEAGTKRDVTITAVVENISGTATGFLCSKEGAFTTGKYTGNVTVKGFKDEASGAQVGIWVE